jgi:hypothetical protein
MGLDYSPRWGHYRRASTKREKDDWMLDFVRAEATAPPPRPKPAEWLRPPAQPVVPESPPRKDPAEVFATLRTKLNNL